MFKKINEKVQDLVNKIIAFFQSDFFKNLLNSTRSFFTAKFELIDQDDRLIDPLKDEIDRLELKLAEAIMGERPAIERGISFVKIVSVVAP